MVLIFINFQVGYNQQFYLKSGYNKLFLWYVKKILDYFKLVYTKLIIFPIFNFKEVLIIPIWVEKYIVYKQYWMMKLHFVHFILEMACDISYSGQISALMSPFHSYFSGYERTRVKKFLARTKIINNGFFKNLKKKHYYKDLPSCWWDIGLK